MKKNLIIFFCPLALVIGCKSEPSGPAAGAAPKASLPALAARVETAVLGERSINSTLLRPGEVKGGREAKLAAALGGYVERVVVETGSNVRKNQPLLYVDTRIHSAQAKLTKVELDDAARELERTIKLGKAAPAARLDAAKTRVARSKAQHTLSIARQDMSLVRAPFAGTVVGLDIERGEVLAPGAPVARLIQLNPIRVEASVSDRDVGALKVGGKAYITAASLPSPKEGVVEQIEPAADPETRAYMVKVVVNERDTGLLPGMIAQVRFATEGNIAGLYVPQDFLVTKRKENGVFAVEDGVARWRPVTLGRIAGSDVEVVSGAAVGDEVVVVGHRDLADGDKLIVARKGVCCENGRITYEKTELREEGVLPEKTETQAAKPAEAKQ